MREQVFSDRAELFAVQMDQLSAAGALAMEARLRAAMRRRADILKACRAVAVDDVFLQDALVDQSFQPPIDRRLPDRRTAAFEVCANIACRYMLSRHALQIIEQDVPLSGFVFRFSVHGKITLI